MNSEQNAKGNTDKRSNSFLGCLFLAILLWPVTGAFLIAIFSAITIPIFADKIERENKALCSQTKPGDVVFRESGAEYICPDRTNN